MNVAALRGVYAIVNEDGERTLAVARAALEGGVRILQYRAKSGLVAGRARALRELTRARGALFIVNDDWRAALACDADGVHLGPDDDGFAHVAQVREAFTRDAAERGALRNRIIGLSCGTPGEARAAASAGADYIGVGPVFATASKADAGAAIGIAGLLDVASATALPVCAIGGINASNLGEVRATNVAMAAVIAAIATAEDPRTAAAELVQLWNEQIRN